MNTQLLLEKEHSVLKNRLVGSLKKKHVLELEIAKQFEQLKKIEISIERNLHDHNRVPD
jgi:hypothetical protein